VLSGRYRLSIEVLAVNLRTRCFHLGVAGLFLWSLGASGVCEARCLELAFSAATSGRHGAVPSHAEPQPSCHGAAPAQPRERAHSLDPSASGGEPGCHCVHTDEALLQPRADTGHLEDVSPALAYAPRVSSTAVALSRRSAAPAALVTLAPHQYRNPPLLI
jgi:hypothetical protein